MARNRFGSTPRLESNFLVICFVSIHLRNSRAMRGTDGHKDRDTEGQVALLTSFRKENALKTKEKNIWHLSRSMCQQYEKCES